MKDKKNIKYNYNLYLIDFIISNNQYIFFNILYKREIIKYYSSV